MNKERLDRPISNLESWFFPEFGLLYDAYKLKPWIIPIQFLLLNIHRNTNFSPNKISIIDPDMNPFLPKPSACNPFLYLSVFIPILYGVIYKRK